MDLFLAMNGSIRRLAHIRRYSSLQVNRPENVAEHSFYVAFTAYQIAKDILFRIPNAACHPDHVAVMALMHDISEAKSGDIIHSFKNLSSELKDAIKEGDKLATREMVDEEFGSTKDSIYEIWNKAKEMGLDGQIVKFADFLSVIAYCREEWLAGNRHLENEDVLERAYENVKLFWGSDKYLGYYVDQIFPNDDYRDAYRSIDDTYYEEPTRLMQLPGYSQVRM